MIGHIPPEKTVAIVVGIEKYDLGPDWNLDGAANDALAFAQLYLRRPLLITGKPGTGKSSLVHAVAHELKLGDALE
jgi:DNA replication protein DnaC